MSVAYQHEHRSEEIRAQFPFLEQYPELAYLDSAASTQKPGCVIDAISNYYRFSHANIHRGVYQLSQRATELYDRARALTAGFLNAASPQEIVFLRGTTEAFNLIAQSFLRPRLQAGDSIIISHAEHHANIVPWQMVCKAVGAQIKALPLDARQGIDLDHLEALIDEGTKLISLTHISNALGSVTDIVRVREIAKAHGIPLAIDGAQAVAHVPVDVQALGVDFYAFSGHKLYGPTGIGALYAKAEHLEQMEPYQGGGDMIEFVEIEQSSYQKAPERFEAGTPHIAGAVGLAEAIRFIKSIGFEWIQSHESALQAQLQKMLEKVPGLHIYGEAASRVAATSFTADWAHPHDIGTILDQHQVAVRTGHHCAQPLMRVLGVSSTTRASFGVYSSEADIVALERALMYAHRLFS